MSVFSTALGVSSSGLRAQAQRLKVISENVANTDTPGYHRKLITFGASFDTRDIAAVKVGRIDLDRRDGEEIYDPGHPMADATGNYIGSNVDLVVEIADAREAQRSYEANLKMFDQVRQMSSALNELLRK